MTPTSDQAHDGNNCLPSTAAIRHEERFYEIAKKMRAVHEILSEIETQYPEFWSFFRNVLRDELDPANQIPEGMDLETWAKARGAQPLEEFLHELEQVP